MRIFQRLASATRRGVKPTSGRPPASNAIRNGSTTTSAEPRSNGADIANLVLNTAASIGTIWLGYNLGRLSLASEKLWEESAKIRQILDSFTQPKPRRSQEP